VSARPSLPPSYREGASGEAICPHRDLSVCPACAAADPRLVDVVGAYYFVPDPDERRALVAQLADRDH
jgi:hypothetical protein